MPRRIRRTMRSRRRRFRRTGFLGRVQRAIAKIWRPEYKFLDLAVAGTAASDSALVVNLSNMAQGAGVSGRQGDNVSIRSIGIRGYFQQSITAAPLACWIRWVVVRDNHNNNAFPTWANVFDTTVATVQGWKNVATTNPKRFTILADKTVYLNQRVSGLAAASTAVNGRAFTWYRRFKRGLNVHFLGANAGDYQAGSIFFMAISNQANAASPPGFSALSRVRYTDV